LRSACDALSGWMMASVGEKLIRGRLHHDYSVENQRIDGKVRQKVILYLEESKTLEEALERAEGEPLRVDLLRMHIECRDTQKAVIAQRKRASEAAAELKRQGTETLAELHEKRRIEAEEGVTPRLGQSCTLRADKQAWSKTPCRDALTSPRFRAILPDCRAWPNPWSLAMPRDATGRNFASKRQFRVDPSAERTIWSVPMSDPPPA
jgi:hypothetical protein